MRHSTQIKLTNKHTYSRPIKYNNSVGVCPHNGKYVLTLSLSHVSLDDVHQLLKTMTGYQRHPYTGLLDTAHTQKIYITRRNQKLL